MLQIFYKTSQIKAEDWSRVYTGLTELAKNFPVQLLRLESYTGYEKGLDKFHDNLIGNKGKEDEYLSVYADKITQSGHAAMIFYRSWEIHKEKVLVGEERDASKTITWFSRSR